MIFRHRLALLLVCSFSALLAGSSAAGQASPEALLDAADAYLEQDNYEASATEYQRFLFVAPEHAAAHYAYYQLGMAELRLGRQQEAVHALRRAARTAPSGQARQRISYRLGLAHLADGQPDRAKMELLELVVDRGDTTLATQSSLVAALAFAYQQRWEQAGELFNTASRLQAGNDAFQDRLERISALTDLLGQQHVAKSPRGAKLASTFAPGSGQLYAGRLWNGLTAMAINLGTSYMLYGLVTSRSYRDAALLGSSVWWRYYQGNRLHAEEAAIQANERYAEQLEAELYLLLQEASRFLPADTLVPVRPARTEQKRVEDELRTATDSVAKARIRRSKEVEPAPAVTESVGALKDTPSPSVPDEPMPEKYGASEPGLPRLVALGADWCGPCNAMAPIRAELRTEYAGQLELDFYDVGQDPEAGAHFDVWMIPTLIYYDASGRELGRQQGFVAKDVILENMKQFGMRLDLNGG